MTIHEFLARFDRKTPTGGQFLVKCPAHRDDNASLAVREGDGGKIVLFCHAGCNTGHILAAMQLSESDLFTKPRAVGTKKREIAAYDYRDEHEALLYQAVRFEPKDFRQRRPDSARGWIWNLKGVRRLVYRLPELKGKEAVIIVEGEKDVDRCWSLKIPATCNVGGAGKWRDDYSTQLVAAGVKRARVIPDNDQAGRDHAEQVAKSCAAAGIDVRVVPLPNLPEKGDVSDYFAGGHTKEDFLALMKAAAPSPGASEATTPAPDGATVVSALEAFIRRFLVLTDDQLTAFMLWVLHCHVFDAADTTPYLAVTSAGKQAGKTRLLEVGELVTPRPWLTGRASAAVLVRKIARVCPTLLLDESDAAFRQSPEYSEALRAILNTGFRRGGKASLCVKQGGDYVDKDFETFCPKAIAGIGTLPDTIADRSIPIRVRRRLPSEPLERFRDRAKKRAVAPVYAMLESWAAANLAALRDAEPKIPDGIRDRAADVWEPLIAIADVIGGDWPARARGAAVRLSGGAEANEDSPALTLLADIQTVFCELPQADDVLLSSELVDRLKELEGRPWADYGRHGTGLTTAALAKLLREFDVFPGAPKWVIVDGTRKQRRGYRRDAFKDAFARWVNPEPSQCNNSNDDGPKTAVSTRNVPEPVTAAKTPVRAMNTEACYGVTAVTALRGVGNEAPPATLKERDGWFEL